MGCEAFTTWIDTDAAEYANFLTSNEGAAMLGVLPRGCQLETTLI